MGVLQLQKYIVYPLAKRGKRAGKTFQEIARKGIIKRKRGELTDDSLHIDEILYGT